MQLVSWRWTNLQWNHKSELDILLFISLYFSLELDISGTLIGRAPTLLGSHWSRASECWNIFMMLLRLLSYAIKNQLSLRHRIDGFHAQRESVTGANNMWIKIYISTLWSSRVSTNEISTNVGVGPMPMRVLDISLRRWRDWGGDQASLTITWEPRIAASTILTLRHTRTIQPEIMIK